jgi:hypothetical protein
MRSSSLAALLFLLSICLAAHADTFSASGLTYTNPTYGTITLSPASGFNAMGDTTQSFTENFDDPYVSLSQTITIDGVSATLPVIISAPLIGEGPVSIANSTSFVIYPSSVQVGQFLYTEQAFSSLIPFYSGPQTETITGTITPIPTAATPEPSSFALLGTGLLTVAAFGRKTLSRSRQKIDHADSPKRNLFCRDLHKRAFGFLS